MCWEEEGTVKNAESHRTAVRLAPMHGPLAIFTVVPACDRPDVNDDSYLQQQ